MAPFLVFLVGVVALGLSGAPDERGFWPVLIAALTCGVLLARERSLYVEAVLAEMSQPIVLLMILAWMFAGVLGKVLAAAQLVDGLVWVAQAVELTGGGFVAAVFGICCLVSSSTGTSLGTILVCGPLLYPAGAALGCSAPMLMGAIVAGATFGDNVSPVSDTTIASATSQGAELGAVVASRLRYALPAALVAVVLYGVFGGSGEAPLEALAGSGTPRGLPMLLVPALVIGWLLRKRHLVEGLLFGILAAVLLSVGLGLVQPTEIFYIDYDNFGGRGLIVDGVDRALGITVFTLLLTGLVGGLRAAGLLQRLTGWIEERSKTERGAEVWLFVATSAAVLLTTHSVVALLAVAPLARSLGERYALQPTRRANILDVTVCTYPFLVPYCIPTVLAASVSASGLESGFPRLSPLEVGLLNFHSWGLLALVLFAVSTGWGRSQSKTRTTG